MLEIIVITVIGGIGGAVIGNIIADSINRW